MVGVGLLVRGMLRGWCVVMVCVVAGCGGVKHRQLHYAEGNAGQQHARQVCYRMLKDLLSPLPKSAHWSNVHPLTPHNMGLGGGKISYRGIDGDALVTIEGDYWLATEPPENSARFFPVIVQYWRDHGWKISYDSRGQPFTAYPPYAPDYSVYITVSVEDDLSIGYESAPFPIEHEDQQYQPDIIEHP